MKQGSYRKKVAVGLSGGVDSAVAAALLVKEGYDVLGVHMLRWNTDMPGCTGDLDRQDALKVAKQLGIPFKVVDFRDRYQVAVVDRFLQDVQQGFMPNPDIWCNEFIKFGIFMEYAIKELKVDFVATGHYARRSHSGASRAQQDAAIESQNKTRDPIGLLALQDDEKVSWRSLRAERSNLLMGIDPKKDQSYFLYRLTSEQLSHTLFPLGDYTKDKVRELAAEFKIPTATKPDSVGICFIGDISVKDFIKEHIAVVPGEVIDTNGTVIGTHEGVQLYTIGQRHGFEITHYQGMALYVVGKDVVQNRLIVGRGADSDASGMYIQDVTNLESFRTIPNSTVRVRHLGELYECTIEYQDNGLTCVFADPVNNIAPGQHAVFYDDQKVLGGGIIVDTF